MGTPFIGVDQHGDDANRRLVRFFSICLASLVLVYSLLSVRLFIESSSFQWAEFGLTVLRVALGVAALLVLIYPPMIARPLERQIALMGTLFEEGLAQTETREKIRLIVLVTMVSLLLELVMIRWLASVFPVFALPSPTAGSSKSSKTVASSSSMRSTRSAGTSRTATWIRRSG